MLSFFCNGSILLNSSLKSELVSIFPSNQEIILEHVTGCGKNGLVALGLPKTDIEYPSVLADPLVIFLNGSHRSIPKRGSPRTVPKSY